MLKAVPRSLLDYIDDHGSFHVIGHKEPDGDCVGSQLALGSWLRRQGKRVNLCSAGPFTRTEIMPFEHRFSSVVPQEFGSERVGAIILDCSSLHRIGSLADSLPKMPLAFIDHHASGEAKGDVLYIDDSAPSVTLLVLALIEARGDKPTREEAELLFFGLSTDTGFFRHLADGSTETWEAAGRLVKAGASPKKIFAMMNGGKSLLSRKLMGEILSRVEPHFDGRLLVSYVTLDDQRRFGLASRDSDMLYQLLLTVSGCESAMIIRQENETECTVGLRSLERVDVGSIAGRFGGGGHRLAAGLLIRGSMEEVRALLVGAFEPAFKDVGFM